VAHDPLPDTILRRRYPHIQRLLDAADPSITTVVTLNGTSISPLAKLPLDTTGQLIIVYEGVPYHAIL